MFWFFFKLMVPHRVGSTVKISEAVKMLFKLKHVIKNI